jgi:Putative zinc-finger
MTCKRFDDWIKDAVHNSLSPRREAELRAHMSICADCRQLFAQEQRLVGAIDRALTECFDREPLPDFAARVRICLSEEHKVSQSRAKSVSGMWLPAGALGILLLVVFLIIFWSFNWPTSFRRSALTQSRTMPAANPTFNKRPKPGNHVSIVAPQSHGLRALRAVAHANNFNKTVPERRPPDTQVLVHPGQWAAIVQLSLAAQSRPVFRGSSIVETAKRQEPVEIKPFEIKAVNVEPVEIEPVGVHEVVIDADF